MAAVSWGESTRSEVAELLGCGAVAAIAVGALEQHGEHLPTDTDTFFASQVLAAAAARSSGTIVLLPALPFGFSPYHVRFGGTVSLCSGTFLAVLADVCTSVREAGASALVIVNGHGGNAGLLRAVSHEQSSAAFAVVAASYWDFAPAAAREGFSDDDGHVGHAGQFETSLALALRPSQVGSADGDWRPAQAVGVAVTRELLGDSGVIGNPAAASRELGQAFFERAVGGVAELLDQLVRPRAPVG